MKRFLSTYWPLLVGVAAAAAYLLRNELTALLTGKPAPLLAAAPVQVKHGVISIDPAEITMEVLPDGTTSPGRPIMVPKTIAGGGFSPPYIAEGLPIMTLNPALGG